MSRYPQADTLDLGSERLVFVYVSDESILDWKPLGRLTIRECIAQTVTRFFDPARNRHFPVTLGREDLEQELQVQVVYRPWTVRSYEGNERHLRQWLNSRAEDIVRHYSTTAQSEFDNGHASLDEIMEDQPEAHWQVDPDAARPYEIIEHRQDLSRALSVLSDRDRTLIVLRYGLSSHGEYTYEEIGHMLGMSASTAHRIEKSALLTLRHHL